MEVDLESLFDVRVGIQSGVRNHVESAMNGVAVTEQNREERRWSWRIAYLSGPSNDRAIISRPSSVVGIHMHPIEGL